MISIVKDSLYEGIGKGTEQEPFLITHEMYNDIKDILHTGDVMWHQADINDRERVRQNWRKHLLSYYTFLFDNACLKVVSI